MESGAAESATSDDKVEMYSQVANEVARVSGAVPETIVFEILKDPPAKNRWLADVTHVDLAYLGYEGIS